MSIDVESRETPPLVVDLDGTFIKTDLLVESFFSLLASKPRHALAGVAALGAGKAAMKAKLADEAVIELHSLPFTAEVVDFIRAEREKGRKIYLASAADRRFVQGIADHVGLFDGVFASDGVVNLAGRDKAELLCREFGRGGFDYIGNAAVDVAIWTCCRTPILANASERLTASLRKTVPGLVTIPCRRGGFADYVRALRLHQWLKNLLLFVPLLAAHVTSPAAVALNVAAFVAFCLCASSVYILNDLLDLASDREHSTKRNRPLASGDVPVLHGVALIPVLVIAAFGIAAAVRPAFVGVLALYYVTTMAYSLLLKRRMLVDVVTLAILYTLRIFAGGVAVGVPISPWLMAFSMFLFLCLAIVKRYGELVRRAQEGKGDPKGRGYVLSDTPILGALGAAAGYGAVMVLALYINSPEVHALYRQPQYLWGVCLLLLYWVSRMLMVAHRGAMHDDPIVYAVKDRISLLTGVLVMACALASA